MVLNLTVHQIYHEECVRNITIPCSHPRDLDEGVKDKSSICPFAEDESSVAFPQPPLRTRIKLKALTRAYNTYLMWPLPSLSEPSSLSPSFSLLQPHALLAVSPGDLTLLARSISLCLLCCSIENRHG